MRIYGLKTLRLTGNWLKSRFTDRALILGYHRISEALPDPFNRTVTPQHFAEQMDAVSRFANPIRLEELAAALQTGSVPKNTVAVTFDDGYADNLHTAIPVLTERQIPSTIFVVTGSIGGEFWWDELLRAMVQANEVPDRLSVPFEDESFEWSLGNSALFRSSGMEAEARMLAVISLYRALLHRDSGERRLVLAQLREQAGTISDVPQECRALTGTELSELASHDGVTFGAHTVSHPFLTHLSAEAQLSEIRRAKEDLEKITGNPVNSFSYPNGSGSDLTRSIVRKSGFHCACTSRFDVVRKKTDLFFLPRFWVPDWNGARFGRWLRHWLRN